MIIYYKVVTVWCKWPWKDVVDERYCIFSTSKKKFDKNKILDFKMPSDTSLEEKKKALSNHLKKKIIKVEKIGTIDN